MVNEKIYSILKEKIGDNFIEEKPEELKFIDKYYIDNERKKFIFICKVFENEQELLDNWEYYQDEEIALALQNKTFKNDDIRWDMYYLLIYKGDKSIDELKCYEIERNRFCCKKLIINAQSEVLFRRDIKFKLPLTDIYSSFNGQVDVANDEYFIEKIIQKSNLDVRKILELLGYDK